MSYDDSVGTAYDDEAATIETEDIVEAAEQEQEPERKYPKK